MSGTPPVNAHGRKASIARVDVFVLKLAPTDSDGVYLGSLPGASLGRDDRKEAPRATPAYFVRPPYRSLYSDRYETVLVRITATDGTRGWGEGLAPVGPEVVAAIIDRLLGPALIGRDPLPVRALWSMLRNLMRERGHLVGHQADALAAVDIALWDLAGKLTGMPVHALLGGAFRDMVPVYVSGLPASTNQDRAALAREWVTKGAHTVKLHLGRGVEEDLATVDAITAAVPELHIAVDAHWVYDRRDAIRLAQALERQDVLFLEAPLAPEDTRGHAAVQQSTCLPIASGEALRNRYEFDGWMGCDALRLAQPDVARTGITEAMVIAELAAARHLPVAPHHSVGSAPSLAAGIHLAASIENLMLFEYQPTSADMAQRVLASEFPVHPGEIVVPNTPGLGIEIDEDFVTTRAVDLPQKVDAP